MIKIVEAAQRGRVAIIDTGTTPKTSTTPLDDATKAARDRIVGNGWDIEDELTQNLMDPLIRELKDQGHWSDVVHLSAAGARETVSGAIATIPDWSGAQNDATQSDTAKQPTEALIGSKIAADFDGSDILTIPSQLITGSQNPTIFIVLKTQQTSDRKIVGAAGEGDWTTDNLESLNPSTEYGVRVSGGNELYNTSPSGSKELLTLRQNGPDVTDFQTWINGNGLSVSSSENITTNYKSGSASYIGGEFDGPEFDGKIGSYLVFKVPLSNTNRSKIESMLQDYYSI